MTADHPEKNKGGIALENALTVDVEDWYHSYDLGFSVEQWEHLEDRIGVGTGALLELLARHHVKGTFFVLGDVARKHPQLVKEIFAAGHEIGSHGNRHQMVGQQTEQEFRTNVLDSKLRLEDLTGKAVHLFRAASWSISLDTLWALRVLEEEGFTCDSSIQPFRTPLSGISGAPVVPFHPVIDGKKLNLVEYPPTVLTIGHCRIPFAGGLYLRLLPGGLITRALAEVNKTKSGMIYVHPWELDTGQPRMRRTLLRQFTHYANLHTVSPKLEGLLTRFSFAPLGSLVSGGNFPAYPVVSPTGSKFS